MALRLAGEPFLAIQGADNQGWVREITAQDALPGLKINQQGTGRIFDFQDGGVSKMYLPDGGNVIFTARPTLNAGLLLGDEAADPAAAGQFGLNGSDAKVYSGGAVHNLSNVFPGLKLAGSQLNEGATTSTTAVDLVTATVSIPAAIPFLVFASVRKTTGAAAGSQFGLKLNSTQYFANAQVGGSSDGAESGVLVFFVPARNDTNYIRGIGLRSGQGQGSALIDSGNNSPPTATVTAVVITALSGDAAVTSAAKIWGVYSLPTS